jgi:putative DNA-invertase from lambdoid prophage Rac
MKAQTVSYENAVKERGKRIAAAKADQKARGRFLGGTVPFGYRRAGEEGEVLVPHEAEQEAIRDIGRLKAQGEPLRAISEALRAKGFAISHEGVSRVLRAARSAS